MNCKLQHVFHLLLVLIALLVAVVPAYAQAAEPIDVAPARVQAADGRTVLGHHVAVDDLVLVCPLEPLAIEGHPCNSRNAGPIKFEPVDDYAIVCPIKEVLDPNHPCHGRSTMGMHGAADDFRLVCPFQELRDPNHPCNRSKSTAIRFVIPDDYALVCPIKEVLDPNHPCFDR